jgi:hypothetical protein
MPPRLLKALGRRQASDREAAELMRSLIDELAETYSRLRSGFDPDVVDQLSDAAPQLARMQSTLAAFAEAAPMIRRLPPNLGEYI